MTAAKVIQLKATEVRVIDTDLLRVSPVEARKTIDAAALRELADSIESHGVQEPLLVRPLSGALSGRFEIVAGQRRFLASCIASKDTCPCIVREMSDQEAAELRVISNLQREDLPPLEEALALGALLSTPGATIESVSAKLAKSASYVSRRLKLLDAIEEVRDALKYGAIEVGHALELARLSVRQQQHLLEWLEVGYHAPEEGDEEDADEDLRDEDESDAGLCKYCDANDEDLENAGRAWSNDKQTACNAPECVARAEAEAAMAGWHLTRQTVAELRARIARTELRILSEAPFPLEDEIPPMACTECPKRSSNTHGLFDDILRDTCTDPDCYETKLKVWVKAELEKADRAEKRLVMLYDGAADKAGVSKWNVVVGAECASQEPAIWVSGRLKGRRVAICRDAKCATHGKDAPLVPKGTSGSRGAATPKPSAADKAKVEALKAEREKLLARVEAEKVYRERLWKAIVGANVPDKAEAYIARQACARVAVEEGGGLVARVLGLPDDAFEYGKRPEAIKRVAAMPQKNVLRAAALALAVSDMGVSEYSVSQGQKPTHMEEVAALLGLDVAAVRGDKAAKPATKKAPPPAKVAKKRVLSPAAKKRIADAQRKRWAVAKKGKGKTR